MYVYISKGQSYTLVLGACHIVFITPSNIMEPNWTLDAIQKAKMEASL